MFRDAAYYYTQLGFKIFPLAANSKLPAIRGGHGFKDATDDAAQIEKWHKEYPGANIGIATGAMSGIVVVDIDPRNGGSDTMVNLFKKGCAFPPCPEAATGNGGKHLFYKLPNGLKASKDRLGKGIDIKAEGGYVVAAPSKIGKSEQGPGGEYRWVFVPQRGQELPPFPKWALDRLVCRPTSVGAEFERRPSSNMARKELEGMAAMLAKTGEGHRNISLNWAAHYAGKLVNEKVLDAKEAHDRLVTAALAAGLTSAEAEVAFRNGFYSAWKK